MAAVRIEVRLQSGEAFDGRIRTIAFVAVADNFFGADLLPGLLIEDRFRRLHRSDLASEEPFLLGPRRSLLAQ